MCSTPFGVRDRCGRPNRRINRMKMSAQRLSASEIGAGVQIRLGDMANNAIVLNAFRRQRSVRGPGGSCSTPFGVRDRCGGPGLKPGLPFGHVLNAFRRQRSVRVNKRRIGRVRRSKCSTPFGVRDRCGPPNRYAVSGVRGAGAQRLSASEIGADAPGFRPVGQVVLNAFRRQRSVRSAFLNNR